LNLRGHTYRSPPSPSPLRRAAAPLDRARDALDLMPAIRAMNAMMGICGEGALPVQVAKLIAETGMVVAPATAPADEARRASARRGTRLLQGDVGGGGRARWQVDPLQLARRGLAPGRPAAARHRRPHQAQRLNVRNFYVFYEVDDDEVPTALSLEEYGGEDNDEYGAWMLLEPTVVGDADAAAPGAAE
jgi:hypothetical protein